MKNGENKLEKRVEDSQVEQIFLVHPEHLNGAGRLFGGQMMSWIDEVAALVGLRHAQSNIVTASVDHLEFMQGAYLNDLIVLIGRLTYVGTSSMEVRVDTYVESIEDGMRRPINRAYVTLVAVDKAGKPKKVPSLCIETESQRAEWEAAQKRKAMHMQRKKEGF